MFIGPELSEKLWIKMPGDLGYKMKEEFDKAYPGADIAVMPRILFAYKYLEARCKEAAFARSLKSVSFCRDIPIPGYYGDSKPKYTTRKARSYKGKPHETHVRIDRRKNLERTSHCKCYLCDEIGHFARDCPNPKRNVKRVAIFEGLNLPNECDIVAVEDNESDSEAIFSLTEGEGDTELTFGIIRESVHVMTHELRSSWRPIVTMNPQQQVCRHQWQDHQEIEAPGTDICLWCEYHIERRARSHCPACLLTVCDICSKTHLGREVPPEAKEWVSPFPDQTALIQQQQLYMNWADQDRARLKRELDDEKRRGQLLFEAERSRTERLSHEITQQAIKMTSVTEKSELQEQQILRLQQEIEDLKEKLREAQKKASNNEKGKGVYKPTTAESPLETVNTISQEFIGTSTSAEMNNRLYNMRVCIRIKGCPDIQLNAILDTGATVCCVEEERVPKEGLEESRMIAQFAGLNSTQQTRKKLKEGYMIISGHTFPLPIVYALNPMKIGRGIQFIIGCNFIRRMGGGVRIEGPTVTFYRNVSTIETHEKSTVAATIGALNEERTMAFPRFRAEIPHSST
nr:polyprotein [Ipomoea batatas]GME07864.1 polyprotein [Ipomoea batatas]